MRAHVLLIGPATAPAARPHLELGKPHFPLPAQPYGVCVWTFVWVWTWGGHFDRSVAGLFIIGHGVRLACWTRSAWTRSFSGPGAPPPLLPPGDLRHKSWPFERSEEQWGRGGVRLHESEG